MRNANKKRQQNFLKEQLGKKFFNKNGLEKVCQASGNAARNEQAIMKIILSQFDNFIVQKELT